MPPQAFMDPAEIDCSRLLYTREQIYQFLPQKHEFAQLDGIVHYQREPLLAAGLRDVRPDEWWCRGHMPGHPIFPGVLMVECAAQMAAFVQHIAFPVDGAIMGFGAIDGAKFRGSVIPPARIILVCRLVEARSRRFTCDVQSYCNGEMVFQGQITGMPLRLSSSTASIA